MSLTLMLAVTGCDAWKKSEDAVRVTANHSAVEKCQNLGVVANGAAEESADMNLRQLTQQVVVRGGNTLFVPSYAASTTGTAYECHPPLDPNDRRVRPQQNGDNPAAAPR